MSSKTRKDAGTYRRKFIATSGAALTIGAAGCIGGSDGNGGDAEEFDPTEYDDHDALMADLAEEARQESGSFTLYTSIPQTPANTLMNEFMDGFELEGGDVYRAGTGGVVTRFEEEIQADAETGDIISVADHGVYLQYRDQGELFEYECSQFENYPSGLVDDRYFAPARVLIRTPTWNTENVDASEIPDTWEDTMQLDPDTWEGRVGIADPRNSGAALSSVFAMWNKFGDDVWDWIEHWSELNPTVYSSHGDMNSDLISGRIDLAMGNFLYQVNGHQIDGIDIDYKIMEPPTGGATMASSPIAITARTTRPFTSMLFMEWSLSEPGVEIIQEGFKGYTPRDPNPIEWEHIPSTFDEVDIIEPDFETQMEKRDEVLEMWADAANAE